MIYSMVTALKYSKMVQLIKANMKWALNRVEVFANGQMEESMTGNLFKIKNKVLDFACPPLWKINNRVFQLDEHTGV